MKKQTKTYLLLVVVLIIWGLIAYKIISGLSPENTEDLPVESKTVAFNPTNTHKIDTFSVVIMKRDPFLGTLLIKPKKEIIQSSKPIPKKIDWPSITYQGLVSKTASQQERVFVLTVNQKQYLARKGQTIEEVTLINGDENKLTLSYKNQTKTIEL